MSEDLASRLEMLLVLRWLDAGAATTSSVRITLEEMTSELELDDARGSLLDLMRALGELEQRGALRLSWTIEPGAGRTAEVLLAEDLRRDALRLFGRD